MVINLSKIKGQVKDHATNLGWFWAGQRPRPYKFWIIANRRIIGKGRVLLQLIIFLLILVFPLNTLAAEGDCGYEGGISSGENPNGTDYDYQEVIFVTGKPVVVKGTVSIKKTQKNNLETWTYKYINLKNDVEKVTVNRTIAYNVTLTPKSIGQVQKQVSIKGTPTERITVDKISYTLKKYDFSKSTIQDVKPVAQYFAGEFMGEKTYNIAGGTGTANGTVTVTATGQLFGYNQYWSNTESQIIDYYIDNKQDKVKWARTAKVGIAMTTEKKLSYEKNKPTEISFEGGYVQKQNNLSVLQYESELPEFDSKGTPTDYLIKYKDTLKYDTFPQVTRLVVPNLRQLKGHWAENDVKLLYSLEVFKDDAENFKTNDFMSRAEFAKSIILAGKILTDDEIAQAEAKLLGNNDTTQNATNIKDEVQIFDDVPLYYPYYTYIKEVYNRKIMDGINRKSFWPQNTITRAQAVTLFIRALGFESRAPSPVAVTSFKDNDDIPSWARNSIYVAEKIGIVKGDNFGNVMPNKPMTKGEVAVMLNRFINYMREDIIKDYRERVIQY